MSVCARVARPERAWWVPQFNLAARAVELRGQGRRRVIVARPGETINLE